ncbi:uncharacterized protein LOC130990956 isoform X2 [Salvia miltiorrhiza]|uniref:uncharacterized protein LOC130990956 isoform X2 n=1 Tax=Salvia miltiorrhiza TaxID=226208 RepID=UPI0025ACAA6C|nr:uncharacterized protein LOC130990956 isoform X2 [Salvia miltiorrhiza]
MEKKVINRFYHEHPLILTENVSKEEPPNCYGCGNLVTNLELAYVCAVQHCLDRIILHKKCGELPSEIWHPKHPQHPISLFDYHNYLVSPWCDLCLRDLGRVLSYRCSSCDFDIDITCPIIIIDAILEERRELQHPSHPNHPLTLMRKPPLPFCCDGCGVEDVDMAYICSICEFWIHKSCASLPLVLPINLQYHHHPLSLAFTFPVEHHRYIYNCDVCLKRLGKTCWVYFCGVCRFFAHIRCVASTNVKPERDSKDGDDNDGNSSVIEFPLYAHDISKELLTPFVMREKGINKIPDVKDMPKTVNMEETYASFSFLFNYHKHPLSLVLEPQEEEEDDSNKIEGEKEEEEDEDEAENDGEVKICDVCVTPISSPPYYECSVAAATACKYFVHSICYFLPNTLSSSSSFSRNLYGDCPETNDKNHRFTLYTSSAFTDMDFSLFTCELCNISTNGRVYECEGCKMKIDVKCASLPKTIRHESHPHHHKPLILTRISSGGKTKKCGCGRILSNCTAYCCSSSDDCDFALELKCAMLPKSIRKHEWDTTHSLRLTFDASLDHPSDFFCDFCEEELHPKKWMYHCRQCDLSFHLFCLRSASGWYRNIKFGRRFVLEGIHPNHPLTFNCVTIKRRCNICDMDEYNYGGLECASCNYLVCLTCARRELVKKHVNFR